MYRILHCSYNLEHFPALVGRVVSESELPTNAIAAEASGDGTS
jgi:hypothetical protein